MHFYLDECYNTGNNWLDFAQPFFTYGGWIIEDEMIGKAEEIIDKFKSHYSGELKSKSFTSPKGISAVANLANKLTVDCKAQPYFICYEKRFMIACKIVEIFFDHETNNKVNSYLTFPNEYEYFTTISKVKELNCNYEDIKDRLPPIGDTKRGLVEIISSDNEICEIVGEIIAGKRTDKTVVKNIISKLNKLFLQQGYTKVANIFIDMNFVIDDIWSELSPECETAKSSSIKSIFIQPAMYEMISNMQTLNKKLNLVVDTLGEQNYQFEDICDPLKVDVEICEHSENNDMIMASDLLVGYIARQLKKIALGQYQENGFELLGKCFVQRYCTFTNTESFWYLKMSLATYEKINNAIGTRIICNKDYVNVVKNQFDVFIK